MNKELYKITENILDKKGILRSYTFETLYTKNAALKFCKERSFGFKADRDFEGYFNSQVVWHTVEEQEIMKEYGSEDE